MYVIHNTSLISMNLPFLNNCGTYVKVNFSFNLKERMCKIYKDFNKEKFAKSYCYSKSQYGAD